MSLVPLASLLLAIGLSMGVAAQVTGALCLSGWEWNRNSFNQDPCAVATMLGGHCRNDSNYALEKLHPGEYYLPPMKTRTGDTKCDCDTVMYSLSAACTTCQKGRPYSWDVYIKDCDTVLISDYSGEIPHGTAVPRWAFYDVTLLDKHLFTDSNAQTIGRDPEEEPPPLAPSTSVRSIASPTRAGAIAGGFIGGVGSITLVAVYFGLRWWCMNKERRGYPEGHDDQWRGPAHSSDSETRDSSFSTGPTFVSNSPLRPCIPPPDPSEP